MRSLVLASLSLVALSLAACNSASDPGTRDVSGTVQASAGQAITSVVAVLPGSGAEVLAAPVSSSGAFTLPLAAGKRYRILFKDGGATVGVLHFQDGNGGYTTLLPVTAALDPSKAPQDAGGDDEGDDISLGDVDDADGDAQYEPSEDPLAQVDSDDDGEADADDDDDDDDGVDDAEDDDDDDNGVDDDSEDGDGDDDGVDDEIEDAEDGA